MLRWSYFSGPYFLSCPHEGAPTIRRPGPILLSKGGERYPARFALRYLNCPHSAHPHRHHEWRRRATYQSLRTSWCSNDVLATCPLDVVSRKGSRIRWSTWASILFWVSNAIHYFSIMFCSRPNTLKIYWKSNARFHRLGFLLTRFSRRNFHIKSQ